MPGAGSDTAIRAEQRRLTEPEVAELTAGQSGRLVEQIQNAGRWSAADEAKACGFAEHVVTGLH